jgi:hypothetical protein
MSAVVALNLTRFLSKVIGIAGSAFAFVAIASSDSWACACGCSVFDVGGTSGLPTENDHGGRVFFEWDHSTQNINWSGTSSAPAANNSDKRVLTDWLRVGFQYMFNREWGVMATLPYANRDFTTDNNPPGPFNKYRVTDLADMEIMGMYTGFSKDMSTGLIFGLKLPTGNYTAPGFDRDTQLGTGSTDLILGGFHRAMLTGDNAWQYFSQVRALVPLETRSAFNPDLGTDGTYRPGTQIDGSIGIVYNNGYKWLGFDKVAPLLQLIGSHREPDSGTSAFPDDTGFDRLLISPGVEFTYVLDNPNNKAIKVYADVEVPVYQRVNGNQLTSPALFKVITSFTF